MTNGEIVAGVAMLILAIALIIERCENEKLRHRHRTNEKTKSESV